MSGTTMVLTPELSEDEYRIVLTWGQKPEDLDSHLTYYVDDVQQYHLYYANRSVRYEEKKVAALELDDCNGYGPETVTLTVSADALEKGVFRYSVRNYTDGIGMTSKNLSLSGAMVRVYIGNEKQETFYIPKNNGGTVWHVFDLDKNGIQAVNEFYSAFAIEVR